MCGNSIAYESPREPLASSRLEEEEHARGTLALARLVSFRGEDPPRAPVSPSQSPVASGDDLSGEAALITRLRGMRAEHNRDIGAGTSEVACRSRGFTADQAYIYLYISIYIYMRIGDRAYLMEF